MKKIISKMPNDKTSFIIAAILAVIYSALSFTFAITDSNDIIRYILCLFGVISVVMAVLLTQLVFQLQDIELEYKIRNQHNNE